MSRLSWNEIRARAAAFAAEWADATYERGQTQTFYNEFFEVFGVKRRRVASFEEPVKLLGDRRGYIDLFWKGTLLVEQKSKGKDLTRARKQAFDYFPGIKDADLPRYVLACDFQTFHLLDIELGEETEFPLAELPRNIDWFGFILGVQKRKFTDQDPVNIAASELMGKLHDALDASGYTGHALEVFLVRCLFCLFADDTGIFDEKGVFEDYIRTRTAEDGSDLGAKMTELFQVLDTPSERRATTLDEDLAAFPYVNGKLFEETLRMPAFNAPMRNLLLEACSFRWEAISPAIFGALFQSVMSPAERRAQGAHYTTERNILKVIRPLFLDELTDRLDRILNLAPVNRKRQLQDYISHLAKLKFFDPACGCGNFLVIAYRELRQLETRALAALYPVEERQLLTTLEGISQCNVDQFHGIELDEFPARIAEVAMWMQDHIMNNQLALEFGQAHTRIPLIHSPVIRQADALELDWNEVLPAPECDYLYGNPPFLGAKVQSAHQREQVRKIANLGGSGGTLDFVAAWFIKGGAYARAGRARIGFVATNSITQGEQVAQLWPILFDRCGLEISFAHRTFAWGSDARGMAHVHVVVIGLDRAEVAPRDRRLFAYANINGDPTESRHSALSPYLIDGSNLSNHRLCIRSHKKPAQGIPSLIIGSKPVDGGHLIFSSTHEKDQFLEIEPRAESIIKKYVGSEEFLNGGDRYILVPQSVSPSELRSLPLVMNRLALVTKMRQSSTSEGTRRLADKPTHFHVNVLPTSDYLVVPKVSSERRTYLPVGWLSPETVPSDLLFVILDPNLSLFSVLCSAMHNAWLRVFSGRLESRYRYSAAITYNAFPWPDTSDAARERLTKLGQAVLDARANHPNATLADLYDPLVMPADLRAAHRAIDVAVDRLYRPQPFTGDIDRAEHLLGLYEQRTQGLLAEPKSKGRRRPQ